MYCLTMLLGALVGMAAVAPAPAGPNAETTYTRAEDIVYSRKYGTALTLDEFKPVGAWNGAAVIWVISGGWFSNHDSVNANAPLSPIKPLIKRGYRVYPVVHRSNPFFTIEDAVEDIQRAVRFVRHRVAEEGHTSIPLGIMGGSAGGHLSLMAGTTGDDGETTSADSIAQASSRINAVGCYFPPTDFHNYGEPGVDAMETTLVDFIRAPFEFKRYNVQDKTVDLVTTPALIQQILADVSPVTHVTADDAPALIIHGDNDTLVPLQQAEVFAARMKKAGVEVKLDVRPGAGHGWAGMEKDNELIFDWFDRHLLNK